MKIKVNLKESYHNEASFYRQREEQVSICCGAIWGILRNCGLPILPNVTVEATADNPKAKYWRKVTIDAGGNQIRVINKGFDIHYLLQGFLVSCGWYYQGQVLWIKITPHE